MQLVLHLGIARGAWFCIGEGNEIYIEAALHSNFFRLHISPQTKDHFGISILMQSQQTLSFWQALSHYNNKTKCMILILK